MSGKLFPDEIGMESSKQLTEQGPAEADMGILEAVLEHVSQAISYFGPDLTLVACNRRYLELLEFPLEMGRRGTPIAAFFRFNAQRGEYGQGEVDDLVQQRLASVLKREAHQFERTRPNGIILEVVGRPLANGGFVTTYTDITERKRVETELQEKSVRLAEAQRLAKIGSWELDLVTNQLIWSDEIFRIFEIDREKFGASYEAFLETIHPDDREAVNAAYNRSLETREPYEIDHRLIFPGDRIKWVREKCETTFDEQGAPLKSLGTVQDITERKHLEDELHKMATTDFLTGLASRRSFIRQMEYELARLQRAASQPVSMLLIDLDHFKQVNDNFGHAMGDALLKHFAGLVSNKLRRVDLAGRLGGEEFGVILSGTTGEAAQKFAERLRLRIVDSPLMQNGQRVPFSVSIGVTQFNEKDIDPDSVLERADKALYRAKQLGRDRVEMTG